MLVTTHQNAMEWHLFTGSRAVVDTLLNKTMFAIPPHQTALTGPVVVARWLRLAHALQLLAMTFTAAQKGWDGVCLVVLLALNAIGRWRMREGSLASWWLAVEGVSATELLARLSTAKFTHYNPDDETSCAELDPRYFTSQEAPRVIQNLNLVSLVDTNTIRVVLWFLVTEGLTAGSLERYLFFLTEQLEAALHLSVGNGVGPTQLLLIRAFLWKSWQRATILFRWYILDRKLNSSEIPPYMSTDFSHFLHRYNQAFGSLPARCVPIPTTADSFQQSFCGGSCQRLYWDKECYVSVREGARAVALDMAEDGLLKYCSASETTMAISHVWSHGQGGRPENVESSTGFNSCLHQKYSAIARRFGCQSYWMDTPCIPEDHDLRKEAIKNINQVFEASQFTLVCDRDIMTIDVRKRHDDMIGTYESLLAALLVCDWNARAWTLLEGYQGRENIHLLCKDDEIIRLADIIDVVHRAGDIVLGNMCLAMDHLIPLRGPRIKDPQDKRFSVEQSGRLLSHRHASRTGDEIVIWSLLRGGLFNTAEDFWRNHSTVIQTGFLISDAPRISDVPGMGWAPARPDLPPATDVVRDVLFLNAWNQQCDEQAAYHRGMAMLNVATKRKAEEIAANVGVM
ncbi:Ankyrin repeat-containing protein [Lasiodiplodia theobromae]|uniref:Ankyrin repeat-containing protein n=1 Tax=Lasiodiplodia theobromae TaxID=45133 RepID=UPI0015C30FC7|nr:Ankyrin repeat-containing protein [Lasiodiplodia theobromae]KAF4537742.1 Ankyrin repeat-containing protein [Lasiodiplodia theobromae]